MARSTALFVTPLRLELAARNRIYARGRAHVESYGSAPVIVYEPDGIRHGNFFDPAYAAILARSEWMRRFDKIHAQAARSLPKPQYDTARRWRELDSSMSSDALLMNVFCTPGVAESPAIRNMLGVNDETRSQSLVGKPAYRSPMAVSTAPRSISASVRCSWRRS